MSVMNSFSMRGKTVLVTGASGHLGTSICNTMAELGADIIATDRCAESLYRLEDRLKDQFPQLSILGVQADLIREKERSELALFVGSVCDSLDVLVNNAAYVGSMDLSGWNTAFESQSLETWKDAIEVNVTAVFHLCQLFAPSMKSGSIVNIGSIYGVMAPWWGLYEKLDMSNPAAYAVSKSGLIQLTKWLSTTLSPDVRVNSLSPGGIYRHQPREFVERYCERTPLRRMANEGEISSVVAFLASGLSSYITGQNIMVDGGWSVW